MATRKKSARRRKQTPRQQSLVGRVAHSIRTRIKDLVS